MLPRYPREQAEVQGMEATKPVERHRLVLDKDVAVGMRDGAELRANVFRPEDPGRYPVLMTLGPYGKDVALAQFMPHAGAAIRQRHPEILESSSLQYLTFETPDPESWVPDGYVVVKIDSRGAGKSPGKIDVNSPAEFRDFFDAIEWAGVQKWSNGKVGLLGISYYAAGQWMVASLKPPHLAALLPWQGAADFYRDRTRHGGMFVAGFTQRWWTRNIIRNQHGNPHSELVDMVTGERNTGPAALTPQELAANRVEYVDSILAHPLLDDWYRERCPKLEEIDLPTLVVANWGGLGLHLRGTIEGYCAIASRNKWLKVQRGSYFITFLQPHNVALQKRFFDRYLKGIDNGWEKEPLVEIEIRGPDDTVVRTLRDTQWPPSRPTPTRIHLDAATMILGFAPPSQGGTVSYQALSDGVTFMSAPLARPLVLAGPSSARLHISSSTDDADLFVTLRAFDTEGKEVTFDSAVEPFQPLSQGWLRVSQRKLDQARSTALRPFHAHDERQLLAAGEIYGVDIEIWPCSIALPVGYRLGLTVQGKDFERPEGPDERRGSGWFLHNSPIDRPAPRYAGRQTLHTGGGCESYLLVPELPAEFGAGESA
jgi:predicted acyl esterase